MDKLTASLEILKFVAQKPSFEQLNISQKTKEILEGFRDIYYNQIPEEVTEIDTVEINLIISDPENEYKSSQGKDDTFHSSTKSELLSTDVIITGKLGAATATASESGGGNTGGKGDGNTGGKDGNKGIFFDSSSNLEILSTDVIITGRLSKQVGFGDDDKILKTDGSFNTDGKFELPINVTITGSLSLSELEIKGSGGPGIPKFLLPTDITIPEVRITDVVIFEAKGDGRGSSGGKGDGRGSSGGKV